MSAVNWWAVTEAFLWIWLGGSALWVAVILIATGLDWRRDRGADEFDVRVGEKSLTITTDRPLDAEDVAAIQHLLTHVMGDDATEALMPAVIAVVSAHAAKTIDEDLRGLGDAS